jgi:hypothetical protein
LKFGLPRGTCPFPDHPSFSDDPDHPWPTRNGVDFLILETGWKSVLLHGFAFGWPVNGNVKKKLHWK